MSRIGKKPVALPSGVTVEIKDDREVTVKGPRANSRKSSVLRSSSGKKATLSL